MKVNEIITVNNENLRRQELDLQNNINYKRIYGSTSDIENNIQKLNKNIKNINNIIKSQTDKINILKENKIYYKRAHTENIMDYTWDIDCSNPANHIRNPNKRITFTKLQWDIMQKELKMYHL